MSHPTTPRDLVASRRRRRDADDMAEVLAASADAMAATADGLTEVLAVLADLTEVLAATRPPTPRAPTPPRPAPADACSCGHSRASHYQSTTGKWSACRNYACVCPRFES